MDKQTLFDNCLNITKQFEGADYDTVIGNFDGQGMSFGILQFNLKSETFKNYILAFINHMSYDYFPVSIEPLQKMSGVDSVAWAKDIMIDQYGKVKPEWVKAWKTFLSNPIVINLQKDACSKYFHQAKCLAGKFGFNRENQQAMSFFYDCAVQVWSVDVDFMYSGKDHAENILQSYDAENMALWLGFTPTEDQRKLIIIAHLRALKCKPEWRQAFFTRKATIAVGYGIVNKKKYDFRELFKVS